MQHTEKFNDDNQLPAIIAGPMVRHIESQQVNFWLVTSSRYQISLQLFHKTAGDVLSEPQTYQLSTQQLQQFQIGEFAFINFISVDLSEALKINTLYYYNLVFEELNHDGENTNGAFDLMSLGTSCGFSINYENEPYPNFVFNPNVKQMLHGSCRKPHYDSDDALTQVDKLLECCHRADMPEDRPALLMMSGDQVYVDDVAGPMLAAIHHVISLLGLYEENFADENIKSCAALYSSEHGFYQRKQLLPNTTAMQGVLGRFFAASKKPIFTSDHGKNHLISLAEVFAMYLLVWSPSMWQLVRAKIQIHPKTLAPAYQQQYETELAVINRFVETLPSVARALAHMPTYMIFDDHDITDDWNLTRGWEEAAYSNEFAKRIIGNAFIGYFLCQGWGNTPDTFGALSHSAAEVLSGGGFHDHDRLIERLYDWKDWHFSLATTPKIVVLDTRTQRWRSESDANKPSGLMDWEALCEMQQALFNQEKVILVSAAPIYGVKMIETIQRVATFFGKPLMVDAENWMAHSGTANVMLNIFRHDKTPPNFIILSGDVHYSFFYEITHRFRRNNSRIFQITASGIKNQFPAKLLTVLERFNRILYASSSPLNWFTKRRRMKIKVRQPKVDSKSALINQSGIGLITVTDDEEVVRAELITATGKVIEFCPRSEYQQGN